MAILRLLSFIISSSINWQSNVISFPFVKTGFNQQLKCFIYRDLTAIFTWLCLYEDFNVFAEESNSVELSMLVKWSYL